VHGGCTCLTSLAFVGVLQADREIKNVKIFFVIELISMVSIRNLKLSVSLKNTKGKTPTQARAARRKENFG